MLRRLYVDNDITVIEEPLSSTAGSTPLLRIEEFDVFNVAMMSVELIGPDEQTVTDWLTASFRLLWRKKVDSIFLLINLEQRGATGLAELAAGSGFIFCGLFPHAFTVGDALVMQYVNLSEDPFAHPAPIVWLHDAPPQIPGGRTPIRLLNDCVPAVITPTRARCMSEIRIPHRTLSVKSSE